MYESSLLDKDSMLNWPEISDNHNYTTDAASAAETASDDDIEMAAITAPEGWTDEVEAYLESPASAAAGATAMKETTASQDDGLSEPEPGKDWFGNKVPVVDEDTDEFPTIGASGGDTPPPTIPPEEPAPFPGEDPDENRDQPDDQSGEPPVLPTPQTTHILYGPVEIKGQIAAANVGPDFVPPATETVPPIIFESMVSGTAAPLEELVAPEANDAAVAPVLPEVSAEDEAAAREIGSRWGTIMQATQAARELPGATPPEPDSGELSSGDDSAQPQSLEFTLRPETPETERPEPRPVTQWTEAGLPQRERLRSGERPEEPAVEAGPPVDILEKVASALRALDTGQAKPEIKQVIKGETVELSAQEIEAAGGDRLGALGNKLSAIEAPEADPQDDEDDEETR